MNKFGSHSAGGKMNLLLRYLQWEVPLGGSRFLHVCLALTDKDLTTSTSKAPTDAILGEIIFLGMMTAILEAFAHFLRKLTLMFVLCKTHRYLSNEEANSGKVRWWELWMQQCEEEESSNTERPPASYWSVGLRMVRAAF